MESPHPAPYLRALADALFARREALSVTDKPSRYKHPLPLRDAAAQIGVSAATLSRVERGQPPDLETFRLLCLWLGRSADELLGLRR